MRFLLAIFLLFSAAVAYNIVQKQTTLEEAVAIVVDFIKGTYEKAISKPETEKEKLEKLLRKAVCNMVANEDSCLKNQEFIIIFGEKQTNQIHLSGFLLDHQKKSYSARKLTQEAWLDFIALVHPVFDDHAVQEICTRKKTIENTPLDWSRLYPPAEGNMGCSVKRPDQTGIDQAGTPADQIGVIGDLPADQTSPAAP